MKEWHFMEEEIYLTSKHMKTVLDSIVIKELYTLP